MQIGVLGPVHPMVSDAHSLQPAAGTAWETGLMLSPKPLAGREAGAPCPPQGPGPSCRQLQPLPPGALPLSSPLPSLSSPVGGDFLRGRGLSWDGVGRSEGTGCSDSLSLFPPLSFVLSPPSLSLALALPPAPRWLLPRSQLVAYLQEMPCPWGATGCRRGGSDRGATPRCPGDTPSGPMGKVPCAGRGQTAASNLQTCLRPTQTQTGAWGLGSDEAAPEYHMRPR